MRRSDFHLTQLTPKTLVVFNDNTGYEFGRYIDEESAERAIQRAINRYVNERRQQTVAFFNKQGQVVCLTCLESTHTHPVHIYGENLHPYSQICHICDKEIYRGTNTTILFEKQENTYEQIRLQTR